MPSYELRDLLQGFRPPPQPAINAYSDKVVCIVGGTSGVGRAAAIQFLQFGAEEVIITCRTAAGGESARQFIETALKTGAGSSKTQPVGKLTAMELDLLEWESVILFVGKLRKVRAGVGGLDYLILNAAVIQTRFQVSPTGWEENVQTNTLGTLFLALLVLPWMKEERLNRADAAHLSFVSSRDVAQVDLGVLQQWATPGAEGVLRNMNDPENAKDWLFMSGYLRSKLCTLYGAREITKLATGTDGRPAVIINIMAPGWVTSGIARHMIQDSRAIRWITPISNMLLKTTDSCANIYLWTGLSEEKDHGKYFERAMSHDEWLKHMEHVVTGEDGQRMQAAVWKETVEVLSKVYPEVLRDIETRHAK